MLNSTNEQIIKELLNILDDIASVKLEFPSQKRPYKNLKRKYDFVMFLHFSSGTHPTLAGSSDLC